jgi:hypothetical protein
MAKRRRKSSTTTGVTDTRTLKKLGVAVERIARHADRLAAALMRLERRHPDSSKHVVKSPRQRRAKPK